MRDSPRNVHDTYVLLCGRHQHRAWHAPATDAPSARSCDGTGPNGAFRARLLQGLPTDRWKAPRQAGSQCAAPGDSQRPLEMPIEMEPLNALGARADDKLSIDTIVQ